MTDEHKSLASGHCIVPSNGCSAVLQKTSQKKDNASEHHAAHHGADLQKSPTWGSKGLSLSYENVTAVSSPVWTNFTVRTA